METFGENDVQCFSLAPFNFLASLINGNYDYNGYGERYVSAFNFLASLINGNARRRGRLAALRLILLTS